MQSNRIPFAVPLLAGVALLLAIPACAPPPPPPGTFATPEEAVQAVNDMLGLRDEKKVEEIFGPEAKDILWSGDETADMRDAETLKGLLAEKVAFEDRPDGSKIALLGLEGWPFPFPLRQEGTRWKFDAAAGREEIVKRRIAKNELATRAALYAFVEAQKQYFAEGRDGNPPAYAQKIQSDEGKKNGLFWPVAAGEPPSPLGPIVGTALEQGYTMGEGGAKPFQGYYYRILTAQGKNAPDGEKSYLDKKGLLTGGFGALAWPAKYGNSGVMTFLVSGHGIVYKKDLGPDTETLAPAITAFDPDATWTSTEH